MDYSHKPRIQREMPPLKIGQQEFHKSPYAKELYGLQDLMDNLEEDRRELSAISVRMERSFSRESKEEIWKRRRKERKVGEVRELMRVLIVKRKR